MSWLKILALALQIVLYVLERAKQNRQMEAGAAEEVARQIDAAEKIVKQTDAARAGVDVDGGLRDDDGHRRED